MSIFSDFRKEVVATGAALIVASGGVAIKTLVDRNDDRCEQVAIYWGDEMPRPEMDTSPSAPSAGPSSATSRDATPPQPVLTHPVNEIMTDAAAKCFGSL